MTDLTTEPTAAMPLPANPRRKLLLRFCSLVLVGGAAALAYWTAYASHAVTTDNAYAAAEIAQITSEVEGTVGEVLVTDTQVVKKGDLLVRLNPLDAKLALAQAEADLNRAVRKVRGYAANDVSLGAQVSARDAQLRRAEAQWEKARIEAARTLLELNRREALATSGAVSAEDVSKARSAHVLAQNNLADAQAAAREAHANRTAAHGAQAANAVLISDLPEHDNPEVAAARAHRDLMAAHLARTEVRSPVDGVVARRQVQLGQRVPIGAGLLSVVPVQDIYVVANFKENQLRHVRVGQPVTVHADIYGSEVTYAGTVEGFSGGSGSAFAAIPAQNATGNWIKVVQRVPVRIKLNAAQLSAHPLKVGLSLSVKIDTRS